MATRSTHKKPKYDRKRLAEKLEDLSEKVAARGIYVVRKNDYNQWDLLDYSQNQVIFDSLPNRDVANKICESYNKNRKYGVSRIIRIKNICKEITKHSNDCVFYIHTIQNTQDFDKYVYTNTRLQQSKHRIKHLMKELTQSLV